MAKSQPKQAAQVGSTLSEHPRLANFVPRPGCAGHEGGLVERGATADYKYASKYRGTYRIKSL